MGTKPTRPPVKKKREIANRHSCECEATLPVGDKSYIVPVRPKSDGDVQASRVVKVGGSLLLRKDLRRRIDGWRALQSPRPTVFIAGGGPWCDAIRQADEVHGLGDEPSHWLAVRAMGLTARLLRHVLPDTDLLNDSELLVEALTTRPNTHIVFDPRTFLNKIEPAMAGSVLPQSWDVSSDSIAARLAQFLSPCELVLLKSSPPEQACRDNNRPSRSSSYVDRFFWQAALQVQAIRFVDLLSDGYEERICR